MDISAVIPVFNEDESIGELADWIHAELTEDGLTYEMIFVDDGSSDNSWSEILKIKQKYPSTQGIKFRRNYGKSAALNSGFAASKGLLVFTLDADLQDSPKEIAGMRKMILDEGFDLVSGWKKKRYDPISKTIPTKFFNAVTRRMSGIKLNDFNCGLKGYRSEVVKNIEVYGEMHRYIPVIAKWQGFTKIGEKVVEHQARKYGTTKFGGIKRFIRGPLDLLSLFFVGKFGKRPMHFFGSIGAIMFIIGFILFAYIGGAKLYYLWQGIPAKNIAQTSGFFIALTTMIIGVQLFLAGFLAELISRNSPRRNVYDVAEKI